jgi:hypothetical protein
MYDAGLFDPLDDDDQVGEAASEAALFRLVSSLLAYCLVPSESINSLCHFRVLILYYVQYTGKIKYKLPALFLDGQDFSDFMQEMLVMMDNVKNEVGASNHQPLRLTTNLIIIPITITFLTDNALAFPGGAV